QQACDIRTGDQQDEHDSALQNHQPFSGTICKGVAKVFDVHAAIFIPLGRFLSKVPRDRIHFGLSLRAGHTVIESSRDDEETRYAVQLLRGESHGTEEVGLVAVEIETFRHDTDDFGVDAVYRHLLTKNGRGSCETPLPESVAQKSNVGSLGVLIFFFGKYSS